MTQKYGNNLLNLSFVYEKLDICFHLSAWYYLFVFPNTFQRSILIFKNIYFISTILWLIILVTEHAILQKMKENFSPKCLQRASGMAKILTSEMLTIGEEIEPLTFTCLLVGV